MARVYSGTTQEIQTAIAAAHNVTFGSYALACRKTGADGSNYNLIRTATSGAVNCFGLFVLGASNTCQMATDANLSVGPGFSTSDGWTLMAGGKATGSATPRFHKFRYGVDSIVAHSAGSIAIPNSTSPGTTGHIFIGSRAGGPCWVGDIAAAAFFDRALTDAECELLPFDLSHWFDLRPVGLWILDQSDTAMNVIDRTGNGANQTSQSGPPGVSTQSVPILRYGNRAQLFRGYAAAAQTIIPSAIGSAEAFGNAKLNLRLLFTGIASAEAFGAARVNMRLLMQAIASAEVFGSDKVNLRIFPNAINTSEIFGSATLKQVSAILPGGINSAEAFGTLSLNLRLFMQALGSAEAFGTTRVNLRLLVQAIASGQAFGLAVVTQGAIHILVASITSGEIFGSLTVTGGGIAALIEQLECAPDWNLEQTALAIASFSQVSGSDLSSIITQFSQTSANDLLDNPTPSSGPFEGESDWNES